MITRSRPQQQHQQQPPRRPRCAPEPETAALSSAPSSPPSSSASLAAAAASPVSPSPGQLQQSECQLANWRRSSATRELYLTKYYFYRDCRPDDGGGCGACLDVADAPSDDDEGVDVENFQANCVSQPEQRKHPAAARVSPGEAAGANHQRKPRSLGGCGCARDEGSAERAGAPTAARSSQRAASGRQSSDDCSLGSGSNATAASPSNSTGRNCCWHQHREPSAGGNLAAAARSGHHQSNLSITQISSAATAAEAGGSSSGFQLQLQFQQQQQRRLGHSNHWSARRSEDRTGCKQRRNSSPNFEALRRSGQQQQQQQQPSIEEQLRQLLDIKPAPASAAQEARGSLRNHWSLEDWPSSASRPANCCAGASSSSSSKRLPTFGRQLHLDWRQAMKKSSAQKQFGGSSGKQQSYQSARERRPEPDISPDDRLMIFMLASRSTSTNSTVERNARILKWLNNCKSAG